MTSLSAWLERLTWLGGGVALTATAFFFWNPATPTPTFGNIEQTAGAGAEDDAPAAADGGRAPECYLGVVLAREAVDVSSESDGLLREVRVRVGDRVQRDQVIARLDTELLVQHLESERANLQSAQARRRRVEIQAERAAKEYARREDLGQQGLLSHEEEESARSQSEIADADLLAADAEVAQVQASIRQLETTLSRAEIRAPFDGTVALRYLDPGARARAGAPVVRLISSGSLLTRFAVPPEDKEQVTLETAVRVEIEALGQEFPAVVEQVAPEIDASAQMVFVEARLDASEGGAPQVSSGAVARVSIVDGDEMPRSCLPSS